MRKTRVVLAACLAVTLATSATPEDKIYWSTWDFDVPDKNITLEPHIKE